MVENGAEFFVKVLRLLSLWTFLLNQSWRLRVALVSEHMDSFLGDLFSAIGIQLSNELLRWVIDWFVPASDEGVSATRTIEGVGHGPDLPS